MSAISEAAAAALRKQQEDDARLDRQLRDELVRITRARLAGLFGTALDVAGLSVAQTDLENWLAVFTDGSVHLAVTEQGDVQLVEKRDGEWTDLAPVRDLPTLGRALAEREA